MLYRFLPMSFKARVLSLVLIVVLVGIWTFAVRMSALLQRDIGKVLEHQLMRPV